MLFVTKKTRHWGDTSQDRIRNCASVLDVEPFELGKVTLSEQPSLYLLNIIIIAYVS